MKMTRLALVAVATLLASAPMLFAQTASFTGKGMAGFGAGVALIGAGWGFGRIGAAALESMARQPEVAGQVSGSMITIAALLEGATFFALIVCLLIVFIAGCIAPPDLLSHIMLSVPMVLLFEIGLFVATRGERRTASEAIK